ncbi:DUF1616 domain-containing protein [Halorubrum sp. Eb13]|uniref:DUF1616 domain-containing protein n=1 Tax=Halorubrum sp. Eb13 TaxID=1383843 RepID=UPI000B9831B3|nr:DUF1616 domain-containing protein [Halorubrum sp. Eb13]OYR41422.1 hypothetical protein DJ75_14025 [Halorubrum sp. Eb13]
MSARSRAKSDSAAFLLDLACIMLLALWTVVSSLVVFVALPGQGVLGLVAMAFVPGYALVAVLFPGTAQDDGSLTLVERSVLAIGLSVCLVPLVGLGLDYSPRSIRPDELVLIIGLLSVVLVAVAAVRRLRLPPDDRFDPRNAGDTITGLMRDETGRSVSTLNVLLIVGLLVAANGVGFAAVSTDRGEQFTEFYILTEDSKTSDLVAGDYPDEVGGGAEPVHIGIANKEGETVEYTVVVLLQSFEGERERLMVRERTLETFSVTLQPGETLMEPHELDTYVTGNDLRVTYLLYEGSLPTNERIGIDTAYRHTHFWVDDPSSETD